MKTYAIAGLLALAALLPAGAFATSRGLDRYEYNSTVRDLLGVDFRAANDFPGDSLTVTPALFAKYLAAAKKVARAAVELTPPPATPELERYPNGSARSDIMWERRFTWDSDYDFHIGMAGRGDAFTLYLYDPQWPVPERNLDGSGSPVSGAGGPTYMGSGLAVDEAEPQRLLVSSDFEGRRYADVRLNMDAGVHRIRVFAAPDSAYPEFVEARGPFGPVFPAIPPGYKLVYTCGHAPGHHTSACVRSNLQNLARRAWRRPVSAAEVDGLMKLVASDKDPQRQMETGIEAILISPAFLFRSEGEPGNNFELASRLSYFLWSSLPDAEKRIQSAGDSDVRVPGRAPMGKPGAIPAELTGHLRLMYDLLRVAFQTDSTRIATLMVGREGSLRSYDEIGIPDSHHPITHHQGHADLIEKVVRINTHHMQLFSEFVGALARTQDGDGSLLDHVMILYGGGLADGNSHQHDHLPTLLVCGAGGAFRSGRFIQAAPQTPITNLYVSMLSRLGVDIEKPGDSTGKLAELGDLG